MTRSGATAVLSLASNKVNALDRETLQEITSFVEFCQGESEVHALVLPAKALPSRPG
jgi:enoyl-CoA hydratase/carnithine racemase